jgi:MFS family permease
VSTPSRSAARRIATARLISLTGSQAAAISLVFLATEGLQGALSPLVGGLGDRFDRRRVMIASDLLAAVCFGVLAVVARDGATLALVGVAFLTTVAESPFFPASGGAVPNLVPPEDLAWANGTVALGSNIGYLVGPALGGVLVAAIGAPVVFVLNAVSFVASAAVVWSVHGSFAGERPDDAEHGGAGAGFRHLLGDRVLRTMAVSFSVFALCVGSVIVAELPLATSFGVGSTGYGLIVAMFSVGGLVGALRGRRLTTETEVIAMVIGSAITAVAFAAVGLAPAFWFVLVAMLVGGTSDGVVDVAVETIVQRRSPDAVRSRVIGALEAVWHVGISISFLFSGPLVNSFGPKAAYVLAGIGCGASSLLLMPLLRRRSIQDPTRASDGTAAELPLAMESPFAPAPPLPAEEAPPP